MEQNLYPLDLLAAYQLIDDLLIQVSELQSLALADSLTGLANRRAFDDRLREAFAHSRRTNEPLAIAVLDLDNFKQRNDTYGHACGDRCLKALALSLRQHSRAGDTVARIGGEEFAILLPDTSKAHGAEMCRRIAETLRVGTCAGGPLTFSAGVAELDGSMMHPTTLVEYADRALYDAKRTGKDRVCVHKPTFARAVVSRFWR